MLTFTKKVSLILFILTLLYFSPKDVLANEILFFDDFNDGEVSDWIVPRAPCAGGPWQPLNLMYGINNPSCVTETIPQNLTIPVFRDYVYEVDIYLIDSIEKDRNFVFKYLDSNNWYGIHIFNNSVFVQKVVNGNEIGSPYWGGNYTQLNPDGFQPNQMYHFTITMANSKIIVEINNQKFPEVYDSTPTFGNSSAGLQASSGDSVWFDNIKITLLDPTPTTSPSPSPEPTNSPTPTSNPTSTPEPSITPAPAPTGLFELPFAYEGRLTDSGQFANAFWQRLTATFDHVLKSGVFRPFTGDTYSSCTIPLSCYDSHNGTDFSAIESRDVYSVSNGTVVYASDHTFNTCTPDKGGFGCVIIIRYANNTFGLFAHLSKIYVLKDQPVSASSLIGVMGNTGCGSCGIHLHFGTLKPVGVSSLNASKKMSRRDWQNLVYSARPTQTLPTKAFCSYKSPSGVSFNFVDTTGWQSPDIDPWSLPKSNGGCGIFSEYLWKYPIY